MTAVKEKFLTILEFMSDEDVYFALELIKENFTLKSKAQSWDNIEEITPSKEDLILISKIKNKENGYGDYISQDDLLRQLDISPDEILEK